MTIDTVSCVEIKTIFIEVYNNLTMKYKKQLHNDYGIDCGYDFTKWIVEHFDSMANTDYNTLF